MKAMALTLAALLMAGVLPAQEPEAAPAPAPRRMRLHEPGTGLEGGPAMRQRLGRRAEVMPGMRAFAPQSLIQRKEFLGLSDEQVARLEQLDEEVQSAHERARADVTAAQEALREAWQAEEPDADAVRRYALQAMQARQAAQLALIGSAAQAKALLTPEQQGKMQGWLDGIRAGRQMHMGRAGMRPGGRQGGMGYRQHCPGCRP